MNIAAWNHNFRHLASLHYLLQQFFMFHKLGPFETLHVKYHLWSESPFCLCKSLEKLKFKENQTILLLVLGKC